MVTKTKTPPEEEVKEPEEKVEVSDEELTAKITAIVKDLLSGGEAKVEETETTEEVKADDGKPLTYREEEARTHSIVADLVAEFKKEFQGDDSKKDDKKEPETKPGPKAGGLKRWVEQNLWGIE